MPSVRSNGDDETQERALNQLRRLVEVLCENLQLRQEADRLQDQHQVLQRRLARRTRQLEDLVDCISEFAQLYRVTRAARTASEAHERLGRALSVFTIFEDDDATETTSVSTTSIVSSSYLEDENDIEEETQHSFQFQTDGHLGRL